MQVARRSLLVINWTILGIMGLISLLSGADGGVAFGLMFLGLAAALTVGINWIFAENKSDE